MIKIDKRIPIPQNKTNEFLNAFNKMKIGESFLIKGEKQRERVKMTYRTHFGADKLKRVIKRSGKITRPKSSLPDFKITIQKQKTGVWRVWKVANDFNLKSVAAK